MRVYGLTPKKLSQPSTINWWGYHRRISPSPSPPGGLPPKCPHTSPALTQPQAALTRIQGEVNWSPGRECEARERRGRGDSAANAAESAGREGVWRDGSMEGCSPTGLSLCREVVPRSAPTLKPVQGLQAPTARPLLELPCCNARSMPTLC